jgi:hypothetical protein
MCEGPQIGLAIIVRWELTEMADRSELTENTVGGPPSYLILANVQHLCSASFSQIV